MRYVNLERSHVNLYRSFGKLLGGTQSKDQRGARSKDQRGTQSGESSDPFYFSCSLCSRAVKLVQFAKGDCSSYWLVLALYRFLLLFSF